MKKLAALSTVALVALMCATLPPAAPRAEADPSTEREVRRDVQRLKIENGAKSDAVIIDQAADGSLRQMRNGAWHGGGGTPREAALGFARAHGRALGLGDTAPLEVTREQQTPAGTRVTLQQTLQGLPVLNGAIDLFVRPDGTVTQVNNLAGRIADLPSGGVTSSASAAAKATGAWKQALTGASDKRGFVVTTASGDAPPPMELVRAKAALWNTGSAVRNVHEIVVRYTSPDVVVSSVVDDSTGAVLSRRRLTASVDGSGNVFDPNPLNFIPVQANGTFLNSSPDSAFTSRMVNRTLREITQSAGPSFTLTGPFVRIAEIEAPNVAAAVPSTSSASGFTYARSSPSFSATNAYRLLDDATRYIQGTLGFTNVMNYSIQVDVRGLNGSDNSHYSTIATPGQGYLAFGGGGVPDAEDGDIVLHEMGHAIQDNQSNSAFLYDGQAGAMGEGFSDFWAAAYTYSLSVANGFEPAAVGEWDATSYSSENPPNLRRVDGTKTTADIQNQVHADGEIWSAALWTVWLQQTTTTARNNFLKIVLQSHFLVPDQPTFRQAAQALLDANVQLSGVTDLRPVIRASMIARRILFNQAPGNLQVTPESGGNRITWTDNSDVESSYQILRSVFGTKSGAARTADASTVIATLNPNTTSYLDTNVVVGTSYVYAVKATDPDNASGTATTTTASSPTTAGTQTASTTSSSAQIAAPVGGGGGGGGGGCFIATAAYGTPTEAHVVSLRGFRDHVLMKSAPGRWFVQTYYACSPPVADWIRERSWARAAVRIGLAPVIASVENPALVAWSLALAAVLVWRLRARRRAVPVRVSSRADLRA